eukprot:scaffold82775_cov27-Tisochrysis_lutea.AAC.1
MDQDVHAATLRIMTWVGACTQRCSCGMGKGNASVTWVWSPYYGCAYVAMLKSVAQMRACLLPLTLRAYLANKSRAFLA